MALADRRTIELSNNAISPDFNSSSLNLGLSNQSFSDERDENESIENDDDDIIIDEDLPNDFDHDMHQDDLDENLLSNLNGFSPADLSPTSRSISPDSLMNGDSAAKQVSRDSTPPTSSSTPPSVQNNTHNPAKELAKKPKNPSRVPIATGISTTIPVTGEKPKPEQKGDPSLEDDVLYAIFVILYEKDPQGKGMTVKQICDILIEQHPEMANLSTKTSNLVSAKLNAYVKRVEKGDANLKYALSRDWADASPKRMVYVYRGLLAENFHVHVKNLMEMQKMQQSLTNSEGGESPRSKSNGSSNAHFNSSKSHKNKDMLSKLNEDPLEAGKLATLNKPRRQTMYDLGITRNTFLDSTIDKSNLFVPYSSAPVTASLTDIDSKLSGKDDQVSKGNHNNKIINESDNDFEDFEVFDDDEDTDLDFNIDVFKKNGKRSKSMSYLSINKKAKILTAAAAAPRASRAPSSHSPNAAAAAAALHAAALKASGSGVQSGCNKKWLNVIRSGFLTQDIAAPEDTSLSDIDKFFT